VVVFLCVTVGLVLGFLIVEKLFRLYVTPQIADIFEKLPPFNVVPEEPDPGAERFHFVTADGLTLSGSLLQAGRKDLRGLVLFLPELHGSQWTARRYCQALLDRGYAVLAFDFRNHNDSEAQPGYSPIHWITEFEMADVAAAMEFIESDPRLNKLPVIAFGVSRGAVAALLTGCRYPRIQSIVADSGYGTMDMTRFFVNRFVQHVIPNWVYRFLPQWHVDVTLRQAIQLSEARTNVRYAHLEQEIAGLDSASVLLISGGRDSYVTPGIAERLRDVVGCHATLWIVEGARHNMSRPTQPEEYDRRIVEHVDACLRPPTRLVPGAAGDSNAGRRSFGAVAS
jgi:pimeloyl-ACP methyl ester carboxylesterase